MGGHAWGVVDKADIARAVSTAIDQGVTMFDTADCYGRGTSEERLGEALGNDRTRVVVASKFGVRADGSGKTFYDNSATWLDEALDQSLRRLRSDYIDLYQVHYWDGARPLGDIFDHLERKRQAGKIRHYGVTNIDLSELAVAPPGLVSFSFEYSLANRVHEPKIMKTARQLGLTFLSWGSLGQGILTGKYSEPAALRDGDRRRRPTYPNFHGEGLARNLRIVESMRGYLSEYPGSTLAQIALRWILDHLGCGAALIGIKSTAQLLDVSKAMSFRLTSNHVTALEELSSWGPPVDANEGTP
jgi:aryl-alcohol dehydrogenase-like predicted oxidoreductase